MQADVTRWPAAHVLHAVHVAALVVLEYELPAVQPVREVRRCVWW